MVITLLHSGIPSGGERVSAILLTVWFAVCSVYIVVDDGLGRSYLKIFAGDGWKRWLLLKYNIISF